MCSTPYSEVVSSKPLRRQSSNYSGIHPSTSKKSYELVVHGVLARACWPIGPGQIINRSARKVGKHKSILNFLAPHEIQDRFFAGENLPSVIIEPIYPYLRTIRCYSGLVLLCRWGFKGGFARGAFF